MNAKKNKKKHIFCIEISRSMDCSVKEHLTTTKKYQNKSIRRFNFFQAEHSGKPVHT